jgi:hypothetical protein
MAFYDETLPYEETHICNMFHGSPHPFPGLCARKAAGNRVHAEIRFAPPADKGPRGVRAPAGTSRKARAGTTKASWPARASRCAHATFPHTTRTRTRTMAGTATPLLFSSRHTARLDGFRRQSYDARAEERVTADSWHSLPLPPPTSSEFANASAAPARPRPPVSRDVARVAASRRRHSDLNLARAVHAAPPDSLAPNRDFRFPPSRTYSARAFCCVLTRVVPETTPFEARAPPPPYSATIMVAKTHLWISAWFALVVPVVMWDMGYWSVACAVWKNEVADRCT